MTAARWVAVGFAAWPVVSLLVAAVWCTAARVLRHAGPGEDGDLVATLPVDILGPLEIDREFWVLVDPIEAEIDRRKSA